MTTAQLLEDLRRVFSERADHMRWVGLTTKQRWHGTTGLYWRDYWTEECGLLAALSPAELIPSISAVLDELHSLRNPVKIRCKQAARRRGDYGNRGRKRFSRKGTAGSVS